MLSVSGLHRTFTDKDKREVRAVQGVDFEVQPGTIFTLLGPSGCGKTTSLRCIAGLERPNAGEIEVNGRPLFSSEHGKVVPPNQRDIGMVFQSYAIWPHMTVAENVAFPLQVKDRQKRLGRQGIKDAVSRVLTTVGLDGYEDRAATKLSGGQQQRLALARALVWEPELLLLDEPLSNLDAKLREEMRVELKRLQRELGITSVYVTHDQVEALALSDRIAVMNSGLIEQIGSPRDIYLAPRTLFVAQFIGNTNLIEGTAVDACRKGRECTVQTPFGVLRATAGRRLAKEQQVMVSIRPEDLVVHGEEEDAAGAGSHGLHGDRVNVFTGRTTIGVFLGEMAEYRVRLSDDLELSVRGDNRSELAEGRSVIVSADADSCRALPVVDNQSATAVDAATSAESGSYAGVAS